MSIPAYCVDDTKKPNQIPSNKWIKNGEKYHITHIFKQMTQLGIQGVELAEIDISDCSPYNSFRLNRFIIDLVDLPKLIEMMKHCSDLNEIDITNLIEELIEKEELILQD